MTNRDIVVIGASAGGVQALSELVKHLPSHLNASFFIVQHVSPYSPSLLPQILTRSGSMQAIHPKDNELIERGKIYIAPPNYHMLVEDGHILIKKGPKENRFRPSIDALFRSAAYIYKTRVIGIVLSGMLDDGTSGMWTVKRMGGLGIIQDPKDAVCASMPSNVTEYVDVDYSVPIAQMGGLIQKLVNEAVHEKPEFDINEIKRLKTEISIASQKNSFEMGIQHIGDPSLLTCPECNGSLVQFKEGSLIRYRCHTGHAFTQNALLANASKAIEEKLWQAVRSLEEVVMMLEGIGKQFVQSGQEEDALQFFNKAKETRQKSAFLRDYIFEQEAISEDFIENENGKPNSAQEEM